MKLRVLLCSAIIAAGILCGCGASVESERAVDPASVTSSQPLVTVESPLVSPITEEIYRQEHFFHCRDIFDFD
jgi:hypothetical protein